jgi:hypothetical protein
MIPDDKNEREGAAGCFAGIIGLAMLFGVLMFLGSSPN